MKRLLLVMLLIGVALSIGCNGVGIKPVAPCIVDVPTPDGRMEQIEFSAYCLQVEAQGKESHICSLGKQYSVDACYLHRSMEVISKEGLVMKGYTYQEFAEWGNYVKDRVRAGLTYALLRDIILAQFTKFNQMLGAQILILGDMFLELPQDALIPEADAVLIASSIDDLVKEVRNLGIWLN